MTAALTKSQEVAADVAALLRARNPLLWIVTREEARVEGYLLEAAAAAGYVAKTWDVAQGVATMDGRTVNGGVRDPGDALSLIATAADMRVAQPERGVWIMRDLPVWLQGPPGATPCRQLRNLARMLPGAERKRAQAVVILSPSGEVPAELAGHATVIEWPLPDRAEIGALLDAAVSGLPDELQASAAPNGTRDAAIDAAVGLSGEEAQACYAKSLIQHKGKIDAPTVAREKKRVVARERVLDWFDPLPGGLESVGGLDVLKGWLQARRAAYSPQARAYGLPAPKGCVLVGVPGCGKSLTAKAIATAWGVPLLKMDMGALKSKFVGDSEANIRKAFKVIEAIGRCVVWIDEIEKAMAGATGGAADGGVSADALGAILNWMQERQGEAFVIATANDVEGLPPELLRKGRFDEVWFVDLPTKTERAAILTAAMKGAGRSAVEIDTEALAQATEGFSGAEIAAMIPDAMFTAFNDGAREVTTEDLARSATTVNPLGELAKEKIAKLRDWAKGRARPATSPETSAPTMTAGRAIDL